MLPLGCILCGVSHAPQHTNPETHTVPMMTLAPPAEGAGNPLLLPGLPDAAATAGVGPLRNGEAPSEAGAERRRTLTGRCSRRTSVKNFACFEISLRWGGADYREILEPLLPMAPQMLSLRHEYLMLEGFWHRQRPEFGNVVNQLCLLCRPWYSLIFLYSRD